MSSTLDYLAAKYKVDLNQSSPIYIDISRLDLAVLFKELSFQKGAEVGVLDGYYSEVLCQANPDLKLYSIDAWQWYPTPNNFRKQKDHDQAYEAAKRRLSEYPNSVIIKKWSTEAVLDFEDESLDFVFIDADHEFQAVTNDIAEWSKKVRKGGIISGHDFGRSKYKNFGHVKDVVLAWTFAHGIQPWFVLESAKFKDERDSLTRRDNVWLWVK